MLSIIASSIALNVLYTFTLACSYSRRPSIPFLECLNTDEKAPPKPPPEPVDEQVKLEHKIKKAYYQNLYRVHLSDLRKMAQFYVLKTYPTQKHKWHEMDHKFQQFLCLLHRYKLVEGQIIKLSPELCKRLLEYRFQIAFE